jgi:hypothetical protein
MSVIRNCCLFKIAHSLRVTTGAESYELIRQEGFQKAFGQSQLINGWVASDHSGTRLKYRSRIFRSSEGESGHIFIAS